MASELNVGGLKLGGGVINHDSSDASSIVLCGGSSSSTTGANITVGGSSGSADRAVIFKSNATETLRIDSAGGIVCSSMPTSDPSVAGQLWNDSGTVKISAG